MSESARKRELKKITENNMDSTFLGTAVVDIIRTTGSSQLIEQIVINKEFGSPLTPAMLYNYYISVCRIRTYDLTKDVVVGQQLGYPEKTIGNVRRKLQKANWVYFDKFIHKGKSYGQWYIGKPVDNRYKQKEGIFTLREQHELGLITDKDYELHSELSCAELPY